MTQNSINVGDGYRRLEYAETLQLGDQFWFGETWQPVSPTYLMQCRIAGNGLYRRPVPQTIQLKPASSNDSAKG